MNLHPPLRWMLTFRHLGISTKKGQLINNNGPSPWPEGFKVPLDVTFLAVLHVVPHRCTLPFPVSPLMKTHIAQKQSFRWNTSNKECIYFRKQPACSRCLLGYVVFPSKILSNPVYRHLMTPTCMGRIIWRSLGFNTLWVCVSAVLCPERVTSFSLRV